MPIERMAEMTWSSYSPNGQRMSVGRAPVSASILSLQVFTSAMISSAERELKWSCALEWFSSSLPLSTMARACSGYWSAQLPTTKNVHVTPYSFSTSRIFCVLSAPQAASKEMEHTFWSRCTQ